MTYYGAKEIAYSFRTVRKNTITIAEEIAEENYGFQAAPGCRTVAQTLAHIALGSRLQEQAHFKDRLNTLRGFDFFAFMGALAAEEQKPRTKAELIALLKSEGDKYAALLDGATDEFLGEPVEYPEGMQPPFKSRFEMILSTKEHEMHHRAQLMMMQRMLGQVNHLTRQMQEMIKSMQAAKS